ncbi:hypothetical protein [Halobacillus sp. B29]
MQKEAVFFWFYTALGFNTQRHVEFIIQYDRGIFGKSTNSGGAQIFS